MKKLRLTVQIDSKSCPATQEQATLLRMWSASFGSWRISSKGADLPARRRISQVKPTALAFPARAMS